RMEQQTGISGAQTLAQWVRLAGSRRGDALELPGIAVDDAPDIPVRGFMLDVSRNRVPRLDTLFELVDLLASLKINQLQLYTEHTFAYRGHETVWRDASPLTAEEVRRLDAFCAERFVELVPNQNSFGHMHRWLAHEPYRRLAEVPEGLEHPFGQTAEPFSLCPVDPRSLELLEDLYEQLLPNFRSRLFNAGLDETFDLGRGRSAAACTERGKHRVYLDFVRAIHERVRRWDRRLLFWADILLERPELAGELPEDVVPLIWGYEADHPFAEQAAALAGTGLDFYLCPGTSSWNSLGGRLDNALGNLAAAARAARDAGAAGYLITDWGDFGHLQPMPISWPGILAGAAFSWNVPPVEPSARQSAGERIDASTAHPAALPLVELLEAHVPELRGSELGRPLVQLGRLDASTGVRLKNSSIVFQLLLRAGETLEHERYDGLTPEGLERCRASIREIREALAPSTHAAPSLASHELPWVAELLDVGCRIGLARLLAGRDRPLAAIDRAAAAELRAATLERLDELPRLWLARSRPGGLPDSEANLRRIVTALA
ncbi:MAG: beta-N-acetylhexosaminidase, partial [Thermoanaerobaculia bacterium]|nr:beta-N-acetylhexosaminidase [Thermoanaerobaculia bacterium]